MEKRILFVCKFNRFRSKLAESYFNKINTNKKIKAKSAGIISGSPIDRFQASIAKKFGLKLKGKPKGLSTDLLKWQNVIIIIDKDIPTSIFNNKEIIAWRICDIEERDKKAIEIMSKKIMKKVENLLKNLKKGGKKIKWKQ